jgi:NAD(P)H dehydrogenase (quinone)
MPKSNILVVFYSRDGSVEALAKAVSEGAREAGAEVRLRRVPDIVSPEVMAKVPGWEERSSRRMLAEYGAQRRQTQSGPTESYSAPRPVLVIRLLI